MHSAMTSENRQNAAARTHALCRSVLMVGTHLDGIGGIRAVVQGYIDAGLFRRYPCVYVPTHRYGSARIKAITALQAWIRVAILLHRLDAPLVHVQMASRASFWRKSIVCLMARLARRPYLLHVHGGEFLHFYEKESGRAAQRFIRNIFANAALVIALSEEWRERLLRICPVANVEVLSNAVALPDLAERANLSERDPVEDTTLLFLGDISRGKGTFDLIRSFARVAPRFPRLKLVCGGLGSIDDAHRLAVGLDVGERVVCPGWLDPERKRAVFSNATIFVLPSYAEGMPMALLEAMSWGLPVITTAVGGIPQLITHEINGLLLSPGDIDGMAAGIARLMSDPELRQKLGSAARATVAGSYSLEKAVERLERIYRRFGVEAQVFGDSS